MKNTIEDIQYRPPKEPEPCTHDFEIKEEPVISDNPKYTGGSRKLIFYICKNCNEKRAKDYVKA